MKQPIPEIVFYSIMKNIFLINLILFFCSIPLCYADNCTDMADKLRNYDFLHSDKLTMNNFQQRLGIPTEISTEYQQLFTWGFYYNLIMRNGKVIGSDGPFPNEVKLFSTIEEVIAILGAPTYVGPSYFLKTYSWICKETPSRIHVTVDDNDQIISIEGTYCKSILPADCSKFFHQNPEITYSQRLI